MDWQKEPHLGWHLVLSKVQQMVMHWVQQMVMHWVQQREWH